MNRKMTSVIATVSTGLLLFGGLSLNALAANAEDESTDAPTVAATEPDATTDAPTPEVAPLVEQDDTDKYGGDYWHKWVDLPVLVKTDEGCLPTGVKTLGAISYSAPEGVSITINDPNGIAITDASQLIPGHYSVFAHAAPGFRLSLTEGWWGDKHDAYSGFDVAPYGVCPVPVALSVPDVTAQSCVDGTFGNGKLLIAALAHVSFVVNNSDGIQVEDVADLVPGTYSVFAHVEDGFYLTSDNPLWTIVDNVGYLTIDVPAFGEACDVPVQLAEPTVTKNVTCANDTLSLGSASFPAIEHIHFDVNNSDGIAVTSLSQLDTGWYSVFAHADAGYILQPREGWDIVDNVGYYHLFIKGLDAGVNCTGYTPPPSSDDEPVQVIPTAPTFTDQCGTANDVVAVPANTDSVVYTTADARTNGVGNVTVTATAQEGFFFSINVNGGLVTTQTWSKDFTNAACPVTPPAGGGNLAVTGDNIGATAPWLAGGAALVMSLGLLLVGLARKKWLNS